MILSEFTDKRNENNNNNNNNDKYNNEQSALSRSVKFRN